MFFSLMACSNDHENAKVNDAKKYYHLNDEVKAVTTMTCDSPHEKSGEISVGICDWGHRAIFDKQGRELEYQSLGKEQEVLTVVKLNYDAQGPYQGFEQYDGNGVLTARSEVTLNSQNLVQSVRIYDVSDGMKLKMTIDSVYDDNGNRIISTHFDADRKQLFKTAINYDSENRKTNERDFDEQGNVIETRTFTYDESGKLKQKATLGNRKTVVKELNYQYELDIRGNWIQKREYKKGKLRTVWQREITYF